MGPNLQTPLKRSDSKIGFKIVFYTLLVTYYTGYIELAKCHELSEGIIKDMIKEDEGRGIYRLEHKNEIKQFPKVDYEELKIFCHHGQVLSLGAFWSATEMRLNIANDNYNVYMANNISMVQKMHRDHQATWFYSSLPWKAKTLKFSPFERTCAGVLTREEFQISLQIYRVNYWQVLMTIGGVILFYYAPALCRNVFFHYTTGVAAGIFLSLVLISYLIQRKFNLGHWVWATYSLSLYFMTSLWMNIKSYLIDNHVYVLGPGCFRCNQLCCLLQDGTCRKSKNC